MLNSPFSDFDGQESDIKSGEEDLQSKQQQKSRLKQNETQDSRFFKEKEEQVLRPIWDNRHLEMGAEVSSSFPASAGFSPTAQTGQHSSASKSKGASTMQNEGDITPEFESDETEKAHQKSQNLNRMENMTNRMETVSVAMEYCRKLVGIQLERAKEQRAPMNEPIYGDSQARKIVTTLLPNQFIRKLFFETTRKPENIPRIRSLFGTPPFNFLLPQDAGLLRASGIASGRTNMTYENPNKTASYSQFGAGHLVDGHFRDYRIITLREPRDGDALPCDIERVEPKNVVYLNVRVPKRSKKERMTLFKDISKRQDVMFPRVGEVLTLNYSTALQMVWGANASARLNTKMLVKSIVPRSSTASTAAVVAVKLS